MGGNENMALLHIKSLQSCPTLCNPINYRQPGSSVHGILQARVLEWVAISFSRGSPGIEPPSPALAGRFFTTSATWEAIIITCLINKSNAQNSPSQTSAIREP